MTLTAELTFQKILSSIELDSDCVAFGNKSEQNVTFIWQKGDNRAAV